jgi:hypothetical protein
MVVSTVSAYQQMQNWGVNQANANKQILGNTTGGSNTNFSSEFGDVASSFYSIQATLAAQGALTRVERQAYAATAKTPGGPAAETALSTARAAGNEILASFGLADNFVSNSSSAPYAAPTNAATGYGYVQASAASLNGSAAINVLA